MSEQQPAGIVTLITTQGVTMNGAVKIPFITTAPGPFSLPNPTGDATVIAIPAMTSGGSVWLSGPVQTTIVNLVASDAGLTGILQLFPAEGFFDA
jgi:hypothetical protein